MQDLTLALLAVLIIAGFALAYYEYVYLKEKHEKESKILKHITAKHQPGPPIGGHTAAPHVVAPLIGGHTVAPHPAEVFLVVGPQGRYSIKPTDAHAFAAKWGLPIATKSQLQAAWRAGAQNCNFGLAIDDIAGSKTLGQLVRVYPMQQVNCWGCGGPSPDLAQWPAGDADIWLYGIKPTPAVAQRFAAAGMGTVSAFALPQTDDKCDATPKLAYRWSQYE
jgi:hypothetical protein